MKAMLLWVMASPWRAALAIAALALSRLFDIFGAALLALVTLRGGHVAAMQVMAMTLPVIALAGFVGGIGITLVFAVLGLWVPVLAMSLVLRQTGSLALMIQAGAGIVSVVLAGWFLIDPEPLANVRAFLENHVLPLIQRMEGQAAPDGAQLEALAGIAPGMMAAGSLLIFSLAVIIGRWWQAVAYNPGGFREDFHRLRQGRSAAVLVAVLIAIAVLTGHPVATGFALAGTVLLFFQGLAMVHGVVTAATQPSGWLWGMYALLALLPLPASVLLVVAGGVDNWLDLRRRAGQDAASGT